MNIVSIATMMTDFIKGLTEKQKQKRRYRQQLQLLYSHSPKPSKPLPHSGQKLLRKYEKLELLVPSFMDSYIAQGQNLCHLSMIHLLNNCLLSYYRTYNSLEARVILYLSQLKATDYTFRLRRRARSGVLWVGFPVGKILWVSNYCLCNSAGHLLCTGYEIFHIFV